MFEKRHFLETKIKVSDDIFNLSSATSFKYGDGFYFPKIPSTVNTRVFISRNYTELNASVEISRFLISESVVVRDCLFSWRLNSFGIYIQGRFNEDLTNTVENHWNNHKKQIISNDRGELMETLNINLNRTFRNILKDAIALKLI